MKLASPNLVPFTTGVSFISILLAVSCFFSINLAAQTRKAAISPQYRGEGQLFIDIHRLEPGKLTYEDVAKAHASDLKLPDKYKSRGVNKERREYFSAGQPGGLCVLHAKRSNGEHSKMYTPDLSFCFSHVNRPLVSTGDSFQFNPVCRHSERIDSRWHSN